MNFCNAIGASCKGRKSETSIYPAFEVILRKTLEQLQRFYSALEHPGKTGPQLLLNNSFIFEKVHKIIVYDFEFNNPELKARWEVESSFTSVDGLMLLKSKEIDRGFFEQHFNIG